MYEAKSKKNKKKKVKNSIGKSGGELSLSAKSNERSGKYIADLDTSLPEKFNYQNKMSSDDNEQQYDRKMRTIRKSPFSSEKDLPTKAGEFSLDTGWSEIGFDQKKKEAVVSFQSNDLNENARNVQEDRNRPMRVSRCENVLSNDMETGVVSMRTKKDENSKTVRRQWEVASKKGEYDSITFDDVEPFYQVEEQKNKLKELKEMAKTDDTVEKTDIQKAITGIQTYINKKNMIKLNFENKFDSEFNKARRTFKWSSDDYVFLMKKKRMLEEENDSFNTTGIDLNDKNKDINKYIFNSKFNNAKKSKLKLKMLKDFNLKDDKNLVSKSITSAPIGESVDSDHMKFDFNDLKSDFLSQNMSISGETKSEGFDEKHGFLKSLMGIEHIILKI